MPRIARDSDAATISVGEAMSLANWLDDHFLACEPEYTAMLRSTGLQMGWHVLDAGCGTGMFLPLIANLVGSRGRISAMDVNEHHVDAVRARAEARQFSCPVDVRLGDVKALPYKDRTFDAIWNANVAQYLADSELHQALSEFQRVLKPGGLLAIKDGDITALQIFPIPPTSLWRLLNAWARRGDQQILGLLRSVRMSQYLEEAGLTHITRHVVFIERTAPLQLAEGRFVASLVELFGRLSSTLDLSERDITFWQEVSDLRGRHYILNEGNLYLREAAVLAMGYKPA